MNCLESCLLFTSSSEVSRGKQNLTGWVETFGTPFLFSTCLAHRCGAHLLPGVATLDERQITHVCLHGNSRWHISTGGANTSPQGAPMVTMVMGTHRHVRVQTYSGEDSESTGRGISRVGQYDKHLLLKPSFFSKLCHQKLKINTMCKLIETTKVGL